MFDLRVEQCSILEFEVYDFDNLNQSDGLKKVKGKCIMLFPSSATTCINKDGYKKKRNCND